MSVCICAGFSRQCTRLRKTDEKVHGLDELQEDLLSLRLLTCHLRNVRDGQLLYVVAWPSQTFSHVGALEEQQLVVLLQRVGKPEDTSQKVRDPPSIPEQRWTQKVPQPGGGSSHPQETALTFEPLAQKC